MPTKLSEPRTTVVSMSDQHTQPGPAGAATGEHADLIGAPFYIMERLEGVILRAHNTPGMQLEPDLLRRISEALIDNLNAAPLTYSTPVSNWTFHTDKPNYDNSTVAATSTAAAIAAIASGTRKRRR